MKEMFDLIRQRLSEEYNACIKGFLKEDRDEDKYFFKIEAFRKAIKIVYEVEKEFGSDINVGSNGWIPVEERLPKEKGWYQCTCADEEVWSKPIVRDLYFYPTLKGFIDNIRYETNGLRNIENYNWTKYVTAWKPLPEAYNPKN